MQHKVAVTILLVLTASTLYLTTLNSQSKDDYLEWKERFGARWSAQEDAYRHLIYLHNLQTIKKHNQDPTQTYTMGVNQFTALTQEQFVNGYLNPILKSTHNKQNNDVIVKVDAEVDWVAQGKVSPVKDQGNCGSCWAFSAVGVLESWSLMNGHHDILSEQQLVDCSRKYGNFGCGGGANYYALDYVKDHGITTQSAYPYRGHNGHCTYDKGDFKITKYFKPKGCTNIINALQARPIGVSADATNWSSYEKGIFSNCKKDLNHNILLVGISSSYYKIKNSWSTSWGQNGYMRLALGNTCGICDDESPYVV